MIYIFIGFILHLLLFSNIKDTSLIFEILYNYHLKDLSFLISLLFQIYWIIILYQLTFRYIEIETFLQIRLSTKEKIVFYLKKILLFTICHFIIQIIILMIINKPFNIYIFTNLMIYYCCLCIAFLIKKDYKLIIMMICLALLKLI